MCHGVTCYCQAVTQHLEVAFIVHVYVPLKIELRL